MPVRPPFPAPPLALVVRVGVFAMVGLPLLALAGCSSSSRERMRADAGPADGTTLAADAGDARGRVDGFSEASVPGLSELARVPLGAGGEVRCVTARGALLVVGRAIAPGPTPELVLVNLTAPLGPVVVGALDLEATVNAVSLVGPLIYAATSDDARELLVATARDPSAPAVLGGYDVPGSADGLSIDAAGSRVFLGLSQSPGPELLELDAADPSAVAQTLSIEVGADVNDVDSNASVAYVATPMPGAEVQAFYYGIYGTGAPERLWSWNAGRIARALDLSEQHLVVVTGEGGQGDLLEFKAPWRTAPAFVHSLSLGQEGVDVSRYGGRAVVSVAGEGVMVVRGLDETPFRWPVPGTPLAADAGGDSGTDSGADSSTSGDSTLACDVSRFFAVHRDTVGGGAPGSLPLEVEARFLRSWTRATALLANAVFVAGGDSASVVRADLVPHITDHNGDGVRAVSGLGDSNTRRADGLPTWIDLLPGLLSSRDFRFVNHAVPYSSAWGVYGVGADDQLAQALGSDAPDAVVSAFGSNDAEFTVDVVSYCGVTLNEDCADPFVSSVLQLRDTAVASGVLPFTALAPPFSLSSTDPLVRIQGEFNHRLWNELDPATIVDFESTMVVPDDYQDTVHLDPVGQVKRAVAARSVLEP